MRAKHNKTLADLRLTLSIMIGALDPLFCLFPNLNEIMIAVVRVNSGSGTQMPRGGSEPRGRSRTARTGSSRVVARVAEVVARVADSDSEVVA